MTTGYDHTYPHHNPMVRGFGKRKALWEAQGGRCCYCGIRMTDTAHGIDARGTHVTLEHIKPLYNGGERLWINEVLACGLCNMTRGNLMCAYEFYKLVKLRGRKGAFKYIMRYYRKCHLLRKARRRRQKKMVLPPRIERGASPMSLERSGQMS